LFNGTTIPTSEPDAQQRQFFELSARMWLINEGVKSRSSLTPLFAAEKFLRENHLEDLIGPRGKPTPFPRLSPASHAQFTMDTVRSYAMYRTRTGGWLHPNCGPSNWHIPLLRSYQRVLTSHAANSQYFTPQDKSYYNNLSIPGEQWFDMRQEVTRTFQHRQLSIPGVDFPVGQKSWLGAHHKVLAANYVNDESFRTLEIIRQTHREWSKKVIDDRNYYARSALGGPLSYGDKRIFAVPTNFPSELRNLRGMKSNHLR